MQNQLEGSSANIGQQPPSSLQQLSCYQYKPKRNYHTAPPKVLQSYVESQQSITDFYLESSLKNESKDACSLRLKIGITVALLVSCVVISLLLMVLIHAYELKVQVKEKPIVAITKDNSTAIEFVSYRVTKHNFMEKDDPDMDMTLMVVLQPVQSSSSQQDQSQAGSGSGTRLLQADPQLKEDYERAVRELMKHHYYDDHQRGFHITIAENNGEIGVDILIDLPRVASYLQIEANNETEHVLNKTEVVSMFNSQFQNAIKKVGGGIVPEIRFSYFILAQTHNQTEAGQTGQGKNKPRQLSRYLGIRAPRHSDLYKLQHLSEHIIKITQHAVRIVRKDGAKIGEAIGAAYGVWTAVKKGQWGLIIEEAKEGASRGKLAGQFAQELVNECIPEGTLKVVCNMDQMSSIYDRFRGDATKGLQSGDKEYLVAKNIRAMD